MLHLIAIGSVLALAGAQATFDPTTLPIQLLPNKTTLFGYVADPTLDTPVWQ